MGLHWEEWDWYEYEYAVLLSNTNGGGLQRHRHEVPLPTPTRPDPTPLTQHSLARPSGTNIPRHDEPTLINYQLAKRTMTINNRAF